MIKALIRLRKLDEIINIHGKVDLDPGASPVLAK